MRNMFPISKVLCKTEFGEITLTLIISNCNDYSLENQSNVLFEISANLLQGLRTALSFCWGVCKGLPKAGEDNPKLSSPF